MDETVNFNMAAAAILILLPVSIFVIWSSLGMDHHYTRPRVSCALSMWSGKTTIVY